jgi:hypothetical protein
VRSQERWRRTAFFGARCCFEPAFHRFEIGGRFLRQRALTVRTNVFEASPEVQAHFVLHTEHAVKLMLPALPRDILLPLVNELI